MTFQFFKISRDKLFISIDPKVECMFHSTAELFISSLQIKNILYKFALFFKCSFIIHQCCEKDCPFSC